jgi:copper chaperone CopZ
MPVPSRLEGFPLPYPFRLFNHFVETKPIMDHHQDQNCHVEPINKPLDRDALARSESAYLAVSGMGCPRCATRVNNSLLGLDGVIQSGVFLEHALAAVVYDPARVDVADLLQAVSDAGSDGHHHYEATFLAYGPTGDAIWK